VSLSICPRTLQLLSFAVFSFHLQRSYLSSSVLVILSSLAVFSFSSSAVFTFQTTQNTTFKHFLFVGLPLVLICLYTFGILGWGLGCSWELDFGLWTEALAWATYHLISSHRISSHLRSSLDDIIESVQQHWNTRTAQDIDGHEASFNPSLSSLTWKAHVPFQQHRRHL
jgi:hypothetical protein